MVSVGGPDSYSISEWDLQILKTSSQLTGTLDTASPLIAAPGSLFASLGGEPAEHFEGE